MTQKNRTLEGKNRTLGGEGGSKIIENRRTSFMHVPLGYLLGIAGLHCRKVKLCLPGIFFSGARNSLSLP